jgi:hypothetical protein
VNEIAIFDGGIRILEVLCSLLGVIIITTVIMYKTASEMIETTDDAVDYDVDTLEQ